MLDELEHEIAARGYRRIFLTTGPRQPEAVALYLAAGYRPMDELVLPAPVGRLRPFEKVLAP